MQHYKWVFFKNGIMRNSLKLPDNGIITVYGYENKYYPAVIKNGSPFILINFSVRDGELFGSELKRVGVGCLRAIHIDHIINNSTYFKPTSICTCGAKHTSRPDYHLGYCDLGKK